MEKTNNPSVRDILKKLGEGGKNTVSEFSKNLMRQSFTENPDFSIQEKLIIKTTKTQSLQSSRREYTSIIAHFLKKVKQKRLSSFFLS